MLREFNLFPEKRGPSALFFCSKYLHQFFMSIKPGLSSFPTFLLLSSVTLLSACGGGSSTADAERDQNSINGLLASFDEVPAQTFTSIGGANTSIETGIASDTGKALKIIRTGFEKYAGAWIPVHGVLSNAGPQKVTARVYSPTAGIQVAIKLEHGEGVGTGDILANEVVKVGWQTLTWTIKTFDPAKVYNRFVMLPNLGKLGTGEPIISTTSPLSQLRQKTSPHSRQPRVETRVRRWVLQARRQCPLSSATICTISFLQATPCSRPTTSARWMATTGMRLGPMPQREASRATATLATFKMRC